MVNRVRKSILFLFQKLPFSNVRQLQNEWTLELSVSECYAICSENELDWDFECIKNKEDELNTSLKGKNTVKSTWLSLHTISFIAEMSLFSYIVITHANIFFSLKNTYFDFYCKVRFTEIRRDRKILFLLPYCSSG